MTPTSPVSTGCVVVGQLSLRSPPATRGHEMCHAMAFKFLIRSTRCTEQTFIIQIVEKNRSKFARDPVWASLSCTVTEPFCLSAYGHLELSAPRSKSGRGLSHWHAPLSKQPKAPLHTEPSPKPSVLGPPGAG